MKTIIKEILCNKRLHTDKTAESKEYADLDEQIHGDFEKLRADLPAEFRARLDKLCGTYEQREVEATNDYFIEGVKVGILLGIDTCN